MVQFFDATAQKSTGQQTDSVTVELTDDEAAAQKAKKQAFNKLQKRLRRDTGRAVADYNMIEDGDRIMVCLSGGKLSSITIM
jgi:tRNA 2-thiocytidine biosynthesis protein TtcA